MLGAKQGGPTHQHDGGRGLLRVNRGRQIRRGLQHWRAPPFLILCHPPRPSSASARFTTPFGWRKSRFVEPRNPRYGWLRGGTLDLAARFKLSADGGGGLAGPSRAWHICMALLSFVSGSECPIAGRVTKNRPLRRLARLLMSSKGQNIYKVKWTVQSAHQRLAMRFARAPRANLNLHAWRHGARRDRSHSSRRVCGGGVFGGRLALLGSQCTHPQAPSHLSS